MSNINILDIGAGSCPYPNATHAIDKIPYAVKGGNLSYYPVGINIDKQKLPYLDNYFDKVVSAGAFGYNFGNKKSAKEILRVLKLDGVLELNINRDNLEYTMGLITYCGFVIDKVINIHPRSFNSKYCFWIILARKVRQ